MGKGKAALLLKRSAKLVTQTKKPKEYPFSVESLKERKEERKEYEDMS